MIKFKNKMIRSLFFFLSLFFYGVVNAQTITERLTQAYAGLQKDEQFNSSILSFYVIDADNGNVVFANNENLGLAPASCTKVITSVSAFTFLGADYTYKTYINTAKDVAGKNQLIISGGGDPSLGSERWEETKMEKVQQKIINILKAKKFSSFSNILINDTRFSYQPIPDGWIWQDIGNYYGAGTFGLNWHENQYDLHLQSGATIGEKTKVLRTEPEINLPITNLIVAAKKGSGDNGYIYAAPYTEQIYATGTIPVSEKDFKISGSIPNPPMLFANALLQELNKNGISVSGLSESYYNLKNNGKEVPAKLQLLDSIVSPGLDKLNYWFLKKSINLYGETFLKTIAMANGQEGSTDNGLEIVRNFWQKNGVNKSALKMIDGSGLSTGNRITTQALVTVMQYAKKQKWFTTFYEALPVINEINMKSGSINGVRAYTGYVSSKSGRNYTFAIIVNNYSGSSSAINEKLFKTLNELKK